MSHLHNDFWENHEYLEVNIHQNHKLSPINDLITRTQDENSFSIKLFMNKQFAISIVKMVWLYIYDRTTIPSALVVYQSELPIRCHETRWP